MSLSVGVLAGISYTVAIGVDPDTARAQREKGIGGDCQDDPRGFPFTIDDVLKRLNNNTALLGTERKPFGHCAFAISGLDSRFPRDAQNDFYKDLDTSLYRTFSIKSLPEACHWGAFLGCPGVLVRCGHGSSAIIRENPSTTMRLIGGWGHALGDPGSGPWIGRQALKRITNVVDGIANDDEHAFTQSLLNRLNRDNKRRLAEPIDLIISLARARRPRPQLGVVGSRRYLTMIAKEVLDLSEAGIPLAREMVTHAVTYLFAHVKKALHDLPTGYTLPICLRGSMIEHSPHFYQLCADYAIAHLPCRPFREDGRNGMYSAEVGIALLALKQDESCELSGAAKQFLDAVMNEPWAQPIPRHTMRLSDT